MGLTFWNKEKAFREAKKYNTRTTFFKGASGCVYWLNKNNLYEEACSHMKVIRQAWDKKSAFKEAKKYKQKNPFNKNAHGCVNWLVANNMYEEACAHMDERFVWTKETAFKEAKKHLHRSDLRTKFSSCTHWLKKHNMYEEACAHMKSPRNLWNKERVFTEAKKYKTKNEFYKKCSGAYSWLVKYKLIDEACSHMPKTAPYRVWNKEKCHKLAKKYKQVQKFRNAHPSAYVTARKNKWLKDITSHMIKRNEWNRESVLKIAKRYKSRSQFQKEQYGAWDYSVRYKFVEDACAHMERLIRPVWNEKSLKKEIKKFKTFKEFTKQRSGAYSAILDKGLQHLMNDLAICSWNKEAVFAEAKKYKTKKSFFKGAGGAYGYAQRHGLVDKVCSHMPDHAVGIPRETRMQKKMFKLLKTQYPHLDIRREVKIPRRDNKKGFVDLVIKSPQSNKFIVIELKHSDSTWSKKSIRSQLSKYRRSFRERKGFQGVYLFSDNGKYGQPVSELDQLIKEKLLTK